MSKRKTQERPAIGWREWVALPELGIADIKAKVDTGARSSALHAFDVRTAQQFGITVVIFKVHPRQRDSRTTIETSAPVIDRRPVRSSSGKVTIRPVILTALRLMGREWERWKRKTGRPRASHR